MSSEVRWLARQARPVLSLLTVNLICMVLGSGLSLLDPLVVRWLIDVALPKRDLRLVLLGTLVFCAVYLASVIVSYLSSFISCVVTQKTGLSDPGVSAAANPNFAGAISRELSGWRNTLSDRARR